MLSCAAQRPGTALLTAVLGLALAGGAAATTYHLDAVAGVDDPGRDASQPTQPWRSVTFALSQVDPAAGPHELRLAAGVYSASTGEVFPVDLPQGVALVGEGADRTTVLDDRPGDTATLRWSAAPPVAITGESEVRGLTVERRLPDGRHAGRGVQVRALDSTASPRLTNVVLRGHDKGLSLEATSEYAATSVAMRVTDSVITDNVTGIFALAYTAYGQTAEMDPVITNSIVSGNQGDGAWFESGASWLLPPGGRTSATSEPVLTHATLSGNVGSGLVLYSYNYGYPSGFVRPSVRSSLLAGNGDYGLLEGWSNTDPTTFENNMLGGLQLALYLDEGVNPLVTIAEVNSALRTSTNFGGSPRFVRGLTPDFHLRPDSPGTDSVPNGVVITDVDGEDRPVDADGDGTATADVGADEAQRCAVTAVVEPAEVESVCGPGSPLVFDATGSAPTAGFPCSQPLSFEWYADGVPVGTDPTLSVSVDATTTWTVVVTCPDAPRCHDAEERTVVVRDLPRLNAGGPYEVCLAPGATSVEVALTGLADPADGTFVDAWSWRSDPDWPILGSATAAPSIFLDDVGTNQVITLTATVTDSQGCAVSETAELRAWRAPEADAGGPYDSCQDPESPTEETAVPLAGTATSPPGSTVTAWSWTTTVGRLENADTEDPSLVLRNVSATRTATVTLTVTDDHGCATTSMADVTLEPSPLANAGGPYQLAEDAGGTTSFLLDGAGSVAATSLSSWDWTTDLGTFRETGTASASLVAPTLDVPNTGADQTASVCLAAVDANGCVDVDCTTARVRTTAPLPPNGVGGTLHLNALPPDVRLRWENPEPDATHDIATSFAAWQSETPGAGGWSVRPGLDAVPPGSGVTSVLDATLLDRSGPDRLFLKVVAVNDAGASCPDPAADLPDCP